MFGYMCTDFFFVPRCVYKVRRRKNKSKEVIMATKDVYSCSGTSALAHTNRPHLRLVYDSRYDRPSNCADSHKNGTLQHGNTLLIVAFAMMLLVGSLSLLVANLRSQAIGGALDQASTQTVHASPNDNLWSIASKCEVDGVSTYDVVQWIKVHNDLKTSSLRPGEELIIPVGSMR